MAIIYIVEDDPGIREIEIMALKNSNHEVHGFERASAFLERLAETVPDLVLLDVMLPDEDGCGIVRSMRGDSRTRRVPVIMITAKTSEMDMVRGLDEGADDYIRKPFSVMELISRVRALLRRSREEEPEQLMVGSILMDQGRHAVHSDGKGVALTLKEYELLRCLMINEGIVLTRDVLMRRVWGTEFGGESRTVDMHIRTLRQKLGESGGQIHTVRGVGYSISRECGDPA